MLCRYVRTLNLTRRWQRGVVPLAGDGFLLLTADGTAFFLFFSRYYDAWTNTGSLQKYEKSHVQSSRIFIPDNRLFGSSIQNGSTRTYRNNIFECPTIHAEINLSRLVVAMFSMGQIPRRPRHPSSSYPRNNVVLVPRAVSLAKNLNAAFLVRYLKLCFEMFTRATLDCSRQPSFSRINILKKSSDWFWIFATARS